LFFVWLFDRLSALFIRLYRTVLSDTFYVCVRTASEQPIRNRFYCCFVDGRAF